MKRIFLSLVCLFLLIGTASAIPPFPPGCSSLQNVSTLALTGMTTNPNTTARWVIVNNQVTIEIDAVVATSNSTSMTLTGLPAALTPARNQYFQVLLEDNSVSTIIGLAQISGTTITFGKTANSTGGFTSSGTKGIILGITLTYNLL